jgi:hypothetical protein
VQLGDAALEARRQAPLAEAITQRALFAIASGSRSKSVARS